MTDDQPSPKPKKAKKPKLSVVEKTSLDQMLEKMNKEYAVILRGSQVLIMRHWIGEDKTSKLVFLLKRDFTLLMQNYKLWTGNEEEKKPVKIGEAWLEWSKRKTYEEVYFEPEGKDYEYRYNLWRGWRFKPNKDGHYHIFLDHIKTNICQGNEGHYLWLLAWLADLFQHPAHKPGTAAVLRGEQGIGKGQFAHHIGYLLGVHYMHITQSSQLTGKFNGHMADKLLMFVDEGWWSDERMGAGILRALITEDSVTIEMKNKDAVMLPNFTRFIIAANASWVVPVGMKDERRFSIFDVGLLVQKDTNYFSNMQKQLNDGGYEALLNFFLTYEYDKSLPRTIIDSEGLKEQKIYSMSNEAKWWHECLLKEKIDRFRLAEDCEKNNVLTDEFYELYRKWCISMNYQPLPFNILPKRMKSYIEFNKKEMVNKDGLRDQGYYLKGIDGLRADFECYYGHKIDWNSV